MPDHQDRTAQQGYWAQIRADQDEHRRAFKRQLPWLIAASFASQCLFQAAAGAIAAARGHPVLGNTGRGVSPWLSVAALILLSAGLWARVARRRTEGPLLDEPSE